MLEIEGKAYEVGFTLQCRHNNDLDVALEIVLVYFLFLRIKFHININLLLSLIFFSLFFKSLLPQLFMKFNENKLSHSLCGLAGWKNVTQ